MAETDPKEIWLQPWCIKCADAVMCSEGGRQWCEDKAWDACPDCGQEPVRYRLAPEKKPRS